MIALVLATAMLKPLVKASIDSRIRAYLAPAIAEKQFSGTLLVAQGKKILFRGAYGMADYELGVPNRLTTRFNIASITKSITQIALLQELAESKWAPDAKLSKYILDFPRGDEISIVDLLNHRSGLPHRVTNNGDECEPQDAASMVEFANGRRCSSNPAKDRNIAQPVSLSWPESWRSSRESPMTPLSKIAFSFPCIWTIRSA